MAKAQQTEAFTAEETGETVAGKELAQLIERIERLEEEKKSISDDIRDVYSEAKGRGFEVKAMRAIVAARKKDPAEREELEAMIDLYKSAIGMA